MLKKRGSVFEYMNSGKSASLPSSLHPSTPFLSPPLPPLSPSFSQPGIRLWCYGPVKDSKTAVTTLWLWGFWKQEKTNWYSLRLHSEHWGNCIIILHSHQLNKPFSNKWCSLLYMYRGIGFTFWANVLFIGLHCTMFLVWYFVFVHHWIQNFVIIIIISNYYFA